MNLASSQESDKTPKKSDRPEQEESIATPDVTWSKYLRDQARKHRTTRQRPSAGSESDTEEGPNQPPTTAPSIDTPPSSPATANMPGDAKDISIKGTSLLQFYGDNTKDTLDAHQYIRHVEMVCGAAKYSDASKATAVAVNLRGPALLWLTNLIEAKEPCVHHQNGYWDDKDGEKGLKSKFQERFCQSSTLAQKTQLQSTLSQRKAEKIAAFLDRVRSVCRTLQDDYPEKPALDNADQYQRGKKAAYDADVRRSFISGALPYLREKMVESGETEVSKLLEIAQRAETSLADRYKDKYETPAKVLSVETNPEEEGGPNNQDEKADGQAGAEPQWDWKNVTAVLKEEVAAVVKKQFGTFQNGNRARYNPRGRGWRGGRGRGGFGGQRRAPQAGADVCFNCHKSGHWSRECRQPRKWNPSQGKTVTFADASAVFARKNEWSA